jgi:hypothetical protein
MKECYLEKLKFHLTTIITLLQSNRMYVDWYETFDTKKFLQEYWRCEKRHS